MTRVSRLLLLPAALGAVASGLLPTVHADFVVLNRDIARSYATDELFLTDATDVLGDPKWLQSYRASDATNGGVGVLPCAEVTSEDCGSSTASVVVGISACLADATISRIRTWIGQVKPSKLTYRANGDANTELKLTFVLYATVCANAVENTSKYKSISRLSGFSAHGSVASALPTKAPVALIAFVKDVGAYNRLHAYAKSWSIPFVYTFQVNELASGSAATRFTNAIYLSKAAELTAESYAPFRTLTPFTCASVLTNGRAFTFYDASGSKQCLCTCPSGYEMIETTVNRRTTQSCQKLSNPSPPSNATIGTCIWDAFGPFKYDVTDELAVCSLPEVLASSGLAVPRLMTTDVDDGKSAADPARTVTLTATPVLSPIYSADEVATALCSQQRASGSCDRDAVVERRPLRLPTGAYSNVQNPSSSSINAAPTASKSSWTTYQQDPSSLFATLALPGYGKYKLVASAADSRHKGSCTGCVAVVDRHRPRATSACPSAICEPSSVGESTGVPSSLMVGASSIANAELTVANVCKASAAVQQVLAFQERAVNDACSSSVSSSTTTRCDDELVQVRSFFASTDALSSSSRRLTDGGDCFSPAHVWTEFLGAADAQKALFTDAKTLQMDVPVSNSSAALAKCSRCCRLRVQLKEKWVDYRCDATYDTERCDGLESEQCVYAQCLTITGRSALTASARVRASIKIESDNVLSELTYSESGNGALASSTEIHRALPSCAALGTTNSSAACAFTTKVSDLIDTSAAFHVDWASYTPSASRYSSAKATDPNAFVSWRYRIAGDSSGWRRLSDGASHAFTQSETPVMLEAWSQCGIVRSFAFSVHLHVHTAIRVCEHFDAMWHQSMARRTLASTTPDAVLCTVPKSDFAELTFAFHSRNGLVESSNGRANTSSTLRTAVSSVVCIASLDARSSVEILRVSSASPFELVRRFAVQLPRAPTTAPRTDLQLQCTFTYTTYDRATTAHTCSKRVVLKDCDAPCFDASVAGSCNATACSAASARPGPYEACASSVITAAATQTQLVNASSECCQACAGVSTVCTPLVALPRDASVLSRCEPRLLPPSTTAYTRAVAYVTQLAERATSGASVLRGGAALVSAASVLAIVLAVAVVASRTQRQKRAEQAAADEQDALSVLLTQHDVR